jgi:hypothetical protein
MRTRTRSLLDAERAIADDTAHLEISELSSGNSEGTQHFGVVLAESRCRSTVPATDTAGAERQGRGQVSAGHRMLNKLEHAPRAQLRVLGCRPRVDRRSGRHPGTNQNIQSVAELTDPRPIGDSCVEFVRCQTAPGCISQRAVSCPIRPAECAG